MFEYDFDAGLGYGVEKLTYNDGWWYSGDKARRVASDLEKALVASLKTLGCDRIEIRTIPKTQTEVHKNQLTLIQQ